MRAYPLPFAGLDGRPHLALVEIWPGPAEDAAPLRLGNGRTLCGLPLGADWRGLVEDVRSLDDFRAIWVALCPACRAANAREAPR